MTSMTSTFVKERKEGDISSVFASLSGEEAVVLPKEFSDLKHTIAQNKDALRESWLRLKASLRKEIDEIKTRGSEVIPSVDFDELSDLSSEKRQEILKRGSVVIRNVISRDDALQLKQDAKDYIKANPSTKAFPADKPVVYELYWSQTQVKARSDPRMQKAMGFINTLWHVDPSFPVSLRHNVTYADRLRIRNPGDAKFALGPHADGGSLERWEDPEYRACYKSIWDGDWEHYDAYDATHRIEANMDLHTGAGACGVFRSFQGWLSMSDVGPGEGSLLVAPLVQQVTAYYLLRPFFNDKDEFDLDSTTFQGAAPGRGQEFSQDLHPELDLTHLMTSIPLVHPGDAVFWHCDLIHAVDPLHQGQSDSSVLYIPAAPLCRLNVEYLVRQRDAFLKGIPGPDFPGYPHAAGESKHVGRATQEFLEQVGGEGGLQAMGLAPLHVQDGTAGEQKAIEIANHLLGF
ncbi:hypothetical protein BZG36_01674 [Bifiguratus adelaidae]|uniref:DUF1479 domain protein n=1 Tax=Bifiguratus adelaidae TaxID=1938954 RepID=A0A261Y501_9FUNG|nr:hypothetical protein BZG36_01674 [Bifiguratus adelaidae]